MIILKLIDEVDNTPDKLFDGKKYDFGFRCNCRKDIVEFIIDIYNKSNTDQTEEIPVKSLVFRYDNNLLDLNGENKYFIDNKNLIPKFVSYSMIKALKKMAYFNTHKRPYDIELKLEKNSFNGVQEDLVGIKYFVSLYYIDKTNITNYPFIGFKCSSFGVIEN